MGARESIKVLERIGEIATLAGMSGRINDELMRFEMGFGLNQGRTQCVYIRDISRTPDRQIITIFSPCLIKKKGLWNGLSGKMAIDLLRRNENVLFARYGIVESKEATMIVASIDHLLDTLDPPEFEASTFHVAFAADSYEREHGQDEF